eukprot:515463-Alexandrium_andersonii.AAC.1
MHRTCRRHASDARTRKTNGGRSLKMASPLRGHSSNPNTATKDKARMPPCAPRQSRRCHRLL